MHQLLQVQDKRPNNSSVLFPTDSMSSEQRQKLAKERREERARYIGKRPHQRLRAAHFFIRTRWIRLDPLSLLVFTDNVVVVSCCFLLAWLSEQQTQVQGKRLLSNKKRKPLGRSHFIKGTNLTGVGGPLHSLSFASAPHEQSNNLFFILSP